MRKALAIFPLLGLLWTGLAGGQSAAPITVAWPSSDKPLLQFTFSNFERTAVINGDGLYVSEVMAQNVSDQTIPKTVFTAFLWDKNGVRLGGARLQFPQLAPYRTGKMHLQLTAAGPPASVTLLGGKTISLRVISVPAGANFKVDGEDAGLTPKLVDFTVGAHTLDFRKEGYAPGSTPLDVGADDLPGGSISFELGGLSQDSVELRDGTTVLGDVMSMSLSTVVVRIDGKDQKYDRNQVKKVTLVERVIERPVVAQPKSAVQPN